MKNYILAGVGVVTAYEIGHNPALIFTSNTLQEQSLSLNVTAEDIRGGLSNGMLGRYFHDSLLEATLTDAMFNLNYFALNAGGTIEANNNSIVVEQVTVGAGGKVTTESEPQIFGDGQRYGWVAEVGSDNWETVTFNQAGEATTTYDVGATVCVKYSKNDIAMEFFKIPVAIIPTIVHLVHTYPLFAGGMSDDISSKTQVGEIEVDIPRFQFNGTQDMSMTSSGAATSNLSGQALRAYSGTSCDDMGQYGTIKLRLFDSVWYQNLTAMYIDDAEFELSTGSDKTLSVYGVYGGNAVGSIPNDLLDFTSDTTSKATVDNTGKCSGVASGTAHIEVKPKAIEGKPQPPDVAAYAEVMVN